MKAMDEDDDARMNGGLRHALLWDSLRLRSAGCKALGVERSRRKPGQAAEDEEPIKRSSVHGRCNQYRRRRSDHALEASRSRTGRSPAGLPYYSIPS